MSVSYSAYAVIGCELLVGKLYEEVIVEHDEHEVPLGAAFCPVCGKPAKTEKERPVFDEDNEKLGEFTIIWGTDRKRAFIGQFVRTSTYEEGYAEVANLADLKTSLQKVLEPFGLWNEKAFGLHAVLYCSY